VAPGYREVSSARMSRLGKVAGWSPLAGLAAAVAAAIPMLAWAVALAARRPTLYFDGDAALDEISLVNSTHLAQLVGNYSRFGWWHPGPAWFYTMDILYVPLGRESWAFSVAVAVFQAVLALLILYICWRIAGLPLVAVGSALLLGYYALVGDALFRSIWPPYLVILPMLLLILLAALGISGSTPALAAALVVGSFEIQTHVGTAPATVAVVGGAFVLRVVLDRLAARRTGWGPRPDGRWKWPLSAAGAVLTVVMWIPPLVDEVTGNPGNLTALFRFFTHNGPSRGYRAALSALGRFVDPLEFPKLTGFGGLDLSATSNLQIAVAITFAVLCAGLAFMGWRARDRFALGLGVVLVLAMGAVTLSIRDIAGPVYFYLLMWVTTLPVALLLGALTFGLAHPPQAHLRVPRTARLVTGAAGAALLVILAVAQTASFLTLQPDEPLTQHLDQLTAGTESALAAHPSDPVVVEPSGLQVWPTAAGIGLQLLKDGHPIRVAPNWVFMFGKQSRLQGDEQWAVVVVLAADAPSYERSNPDATLAGTNGVYSVFLRKIR